MDALVDTVIFDLGNVLIEWDRRNLYSKLIDDADELDHFLDTVMTLEVNAQLDRGTPLGEVVRPVAERNPKYRELIEVFAERWIETLGDVITGSVDILLELASREVPLFALSNWGRDTFALIESDYEFFQAFDAMVISGQEGVVKPDPEIFEILCERHGLTPQRSVFIDDSPVNVEAALALGFDALLFESPALLRSQLVERNLL